jgi:Bacterial dnaA protein helix-turn-helix
MLERDLTDVDWAALHLDGITRAHWPDLLAGSPIADQFAALADEDRFLAMAHEFRQSVAARPWINQCIVAREVGARAFGITTSDILKDDRRPDLVDKRHKIVAFARVMTGASYSHIGRHFGRNHSGVAYACEKYESLIRFMVGQHGCAK